MIVASRHSQYVPRSSSTSVFPCNDGLDTRTAPCPLYEGKDHDGKCSFVSFFEPVAIAFTQASSVSVTVHYCMSSLAIASNCSHAFRRNNSIITTPRVTFYCHFRKTSLTVSIRSCILFSLVYTLGSSYVSFCGSEQNGVIVEWKAAIGTSKRCLFLLKRTTSCCGNIKVN